MKGSPRFYFWSAFLILSLVVSGMCLRLLAVDGISLSESLITRGVSSLVFVFIFAFTKKFSLKPRKIKTQILRALVAGMALTLFTLSYKWLTASAVSVLSNIDVPLLVVLGPLAGVKASWKTRALALGSISFLIWYVTGLEAQVQLSYGLASLAIGTLLLCFGYIFIKKSMSEENEAVTILVPSLALIVYGLAIFGGTSTSWTPFLAVMAFASGASMFVAYYATMRLYEQTDLASAEFPTLIAAIVIQPLEAIFLNNPLRGTYMISSVGFVVIIYFLLVLQSRELSRV